MISLTYGQLPTPKFLRLHLAHRGYDCNELMRVMRLSLNRHGPTENLRLMLEALGFEWKPLAGCTCGKTPCMCSDVAAVADALEEKAP